YGEQVMAFIRLKPGETMTEDEVRAYCEGKIAHYKIPKYIKFVNEYPMTASGKVQKYKLREMAIRELGLEAASDIETA
nr:AMP-binding protein [Bacillota bacterium]